MRITAVSLYAPGLRDAGERVRIGSLLDELGRTHEVTLLSWQVPDEGVGEIGRRYRWIVAPTELQTPGGLKPIDYARAAATHSLVQWRATRRRHSLRAWVAGQMSELRPEVVIAIQFSGVAAIPDALLGRTVVDTHNAEGLRWARIAGAHGPGPVRLLAKQQELAARRLERRVGQKTATLIAVSSEDASYFSTLGAQTDIVTNGFSPPSLYRPTGDMNPDALKLLFIGSFDYSANADALGWLVEIAATFPSGATLTLVGSGDEARVRKQFAHLTNVIVRGRVDNVSEVYASHDVLLVPLRMGGGSRLKILEGIAHGLVVITTEVGVEGLPLTAHEDYLLAESKEDWAISLNRLATRPDATRAMRESAQRRVSHMTWGSAGSALEAVIRARI